MLTSRERVQITLNHQEPDCIPLDLGSSAVTGMHVSSVYLLRQALGLDKPGTPVKVVEPYQMLGEIKPDLQSALGVDVVGLGKNKTLFGFTNENWKPWTTFDGTPVLVPGDFNTEPNENGDILMYPEGDKTAPPSGRMPKGGFYFDTIVRQPPIDDANLRVEDNLEEFGIITDEELSYLGKQADEIYYSTDKAILANFGGTAFGDIALVPAPWLKNPKGIRDVEEWYVSTVTRKEYVYQIFHRQCEIGIENLQKIYEVVGNKVDAVFITGTDFGTQQGPFISKRTYQELFKPFHKQINDWIHSNTKWKSFIHSCGSIARLIPEFIEAGFDILNPVQCSAEEMDPVELKNRYGHILTFWGGGIDTQFTLPRGSIEQVRNEVIQRIEVFSKGGGFIFNTIHNVQPCVPVENLLVLYRTFAEFRDYSKRR